MGEWEGGQPIDVNLWKSEEQMRERKGRKWVGGGAFVVRRDEGVEDGQQKEGPMVAETI
jgi:hypothetical protein